MRQCEGRADQSRGGTARAAGGAPGGVQYGENDPNMQVKKTDTPGVLKLNLGAGSYQWKFVPVAGKTFTDSGTDECH